MPTMPEVESFINEQPVTLWRPYSGCKQPIA
jgi:hypothetical protein